MLSILKLFVLKELLVCLLFVKSGKQTPDLHAEVKISNQNHKSHEESHTLLHMYNEKYITMSQKCKGAFPDLAGLMSFQ